MWINKMMSNPLREGRYKTLVGDDFGNLSEATNELFNGVDWCHYWSNRQFIEYWWASDEDYIIILDKLEDDKESSEKFAKFVLFGLDHAEENKRG